jgi:transaldolase
MRNPMLFLDSARVEDARKAARWEWVRGITTNPTLLAQSDLAPEETLRQLAETIPGPVFYQLTAPDVPEMYNEAERAHALLGDRLILKIAASSIGFEAAAQLSVHYDVAITAVFSTSQALVAEAAGARYLALYYNRAMRLMEDGPGFVRAVVEVMEGGSCEVIAASIKSPEEAVAARRAGIPHLTLSLAVLKMLVRSEISEQAITEFNRDGRGIV